MANILTLRPDFSPRPRLLLEICRETFDRLLATVAAENAHPVEHAVVAADPRSKTVLLAVLLPDRFEAVRASHTVESNGVDYPIIAVVEPPGSVRLTCTRREWLGLFTRDGRAFATEPKVKDEVVFRRAELLRCLAETRREERKKARDGRGLGEVKGLGHAGDDTHRDGNAVEDSGQGQKKQRLREKNRRQRARRKEEAQRASELQQLEHEVIQEGVTADELSKGFKLVQIGSEVYFDELAEAKKLGLKVVRL